MKQRYFPTTKDIVYGALAAIHNHRFIKNPIVYTPTLNSQGEYTAVPIQRYRTYDGKELIEPGLTLAIYPATNNKREFSGYQAQSETCTFTPFEMGRKDINYQYEGIYRFIVALYYQEVAINEQKQIIYFPVKDTSNVVVENRQIAKEHDTQLWDPREVTVEINPAEDILRDYVDVLRMVLEEITIDGMLPWRVRGCQVKSYDFPTTSWSATSENIYFHFAYLSWELSLYAPAIMKQDIEIPKIKDFTFYTNEDPETIKNS